MLSIFGPRPPNRRLLEDPPGQQAVRFRDSSNAFFDAPSINMYFNGIYYPNWHIYKGLPPSSLKFDVISHAFYAFAHVKEDGTVFLSDEWADSQMEVDGTQGCLRSFADLKKKYSVLRVVLSVGGGGAASEPFPAAASTDETRERFAHTAKELVTSYGLDGIDGKSSFPFRPSRSKLSCVFYFPSARKRNFHSSSSYEAVSISTFASLRGQSQRNCSPILPGIVETFVQTEMFR